MTLSIPNITPSIPSIKSHYGLSMQICHNIIPSIPSIIWYQRKRKTQITAKSNPNTSHHHITSSSADAIKSNPNTSHHHITSSSADAIKSNPNTSHHHITSSSADTAKSNPKRPKKNGNKSEVKNIDKKYLIEKHIEQERNRQRARGWNMQTLLWAIRGRLAVLSITRSVW